MQVPRLRAPAGSTASSPWSRCARDDEVRGARAARLKAAPFQDNCKGFVPRFGSAFLAQLRFAWDNTTSDNPLAARFLGRALSLPITKCFCPMKLFTGVDRIASDL